MNKYANIRRILRTQTRSQIRPGRNMKNSMCLSTQNYFMIVPIRSKCKKPSFSHTTYLMNTSHEKFNTSYISKENSQIRTTLKEYEPAYKFEKHKNAYNETVTPFNDLKKKLDEFASKLDYLRFNNEFMRMINPDRCYDISIKTGRRNYYKLHCRMQKVPMYISIIVNKGNGRMVFSQSIEKPDVKNCDKEIHLIENQINDSYASNLETKKIFCEDNIYMSIEAIKEISIIFQYSFGKGII